MTDTKLHRGEKKPEKKSAISPISLSLSLSFSLSHSLLLSCFCSSSAVRLLTGRPSQPSRTLHHDEGALLWALKRYLFRTGSSADGPKPGALLESLSCPASLRLLSPLTELGPGFCPEKEEEEEEEQQLKKCLTQHFCPSPSHQSGTEAGTRPGWGRQKRGEKGREREKEGGERTNKCECLRHSKAPW